MNTRDDDGSSMLVGRNLASGDFGEQPVVTEFRTV